jgi:hypothetical protein
MSDAVFAEHCLFHANFIPRRNPKFDWTKPVDGSDPESDWKGLLSLMNHQICSILLVAGFITPHFVGLLPVQVA